VDFFAVAGGREDWRLLKEGGEMVDGLLINKVFALQGRGSLSFLCLTTFGSVLLLLLLLLVVVEIELGVLLLLLVGLLVLLLLVCCATSLILWCFVNVQGRQICCRGLVDNLEV